MACAPVPALSPSSVPLATQAPHAPQRPSRSTRRRRGLAAARRAGAAHACTAHALHMHCPCTAHALHMHCICTAHACMQVPPSPALLQPSRLCCYCPTVTTRGCSVPSQVSRLAPLAHVFGHTHFSIDVTLGHTRFVVQHVRKCRLGAAAARCPSLVWLGSPGLLAAPRTRDAPLRREPRRAQREACGAAVRARPPPPILRRPTPSRCSIRSATPRSASSPAVSSRCASPRAHARRSPRSGRRQTSTSPTPAAARSARRARRHCGGGLTRRSSASS